MIKIGSHVSLKGDEMFLGSVEEALSYGANCLMVYTGAPQNTRRKEMDTFKIEEAHQLMKENNLDLKDVVIHAPYIVNLANPSAEKRNFAVSFLSQEIKRSAAMGATQMVLHPGNAVGKDLDEAIDWIAEGLNKIINNTKDLNVVIALETMAGKGTEVGRNFEELKRIIDQVEDKSRVGVCFDTCHTSDSGYDIKNDFESVITHFDNIIGLDYLTVFHINDSKNEMGSRKDRHENLGFGTIGFDALVNIIYDKRFENIPKILESPYYEGKPPYLHEIKMIKEKKFNENLLEDILND